MPTLTWPDDLTAVTLSGYSIRESNMIGRYRAYGLPDLPDDPAGVTYTHSGTFVGETGFTSDNPGLLTVGLYLHMASGANNSLFKLFTNPANAVYRALIRTSGTSVKATYWNGSAYTYTPSITVTPNAWTLVSFVIPNANAVAKYCGIGANAADAYDIAAWYIGTGAYLPSSLPDLSGSGNHYTVFAGSPDGSGNIVRNGVSSYERSDSVLASVPDEQYFSVEMPNGNATLATRQVFVNYKAVSNTVGFLQIDRFESTNTWRVAYSNGTAASAIEFVSLFTGYTSTRLVLGIYINWITGAIRVYRNGALFGTGTMTTPVKPTAGSYLYLGAYQGTQYFAAGTFGNQFVYDAEATYTQRIYNYNNSTFYQALPPPHGDSYQPVDQDGTIRTDMETGYASIRSRFSATCETLPFQLFCTETQWQVLKQFYLETGGALTFAFTKPNTGELVTARFRKRPTATLRNHVYWMANVELEVMP